MSKINDVMEKIDVEKFRLGFTIAMDLFAAGNAILAILKSGEDLNDEALVKIIEIHNDEMKNARMELIKSIQRRKNEAPQS